jgi:16S rRNA (cytosine967-C5)-methyltransferase
MPRRRVAPAPDARTIAHGVLVRIETSEAFADRLLAARLAETRLGAADRALVTRLVYGTLAWRGRLDHHLGGLLRTPLGALAAPVRAALRLGLYQLLFLDRIPAYAAVDASVRLARRAAGRGAGGLVNAVLRRAAAAGRGGLALPDPAVDPLGRLAVEWSHPRWLVERWADEVGMEELPALLAADNVRGATALRANTLRTTRAALLAELEADQVVAAPGRWATEAIVVRRGAGRLRGLPGWRAGRFAFQGEASQLVTPLLGLAPGQRVLDACAAPGGKSGHAAALLGDVGLVAALDRRPGGARRIAAEAARLGATCVRALAGDATRPPLGVVFDAVLVDAPCSGLGTLRRHPELRWRRRAEDVPRLAGVQRDILHAVAALVRPGGVLVYAVCTPMRDETDAVIDGFLAVDRGFVVEPLPGSVAALPDALTRGGFLRTFPHRHGLDGFFAARLRRCRDLASRPRLR